MVFTLIGHCMSSRITDTMGDVLVSEVEWRELQRELDDVRRDTARVNSFMEQHGNKKWHVCLAC